MVNIALADRNAFVQLPDRSVLECRVLSSSTPDRELAAFASIHNMGWPNLPKVTPKILGENAEKGIIVGTYSDQKPANLLRIVGLYISKADGIVANDGMDTREKAYEILRFCPQTYDEITNGGKWHPMPQDANVLGLIDITSHPDFKGKPVARGAIEYVKITYLLGMNGSTASPGLNGIKLAFTFTPKPHDYDGDFERYNAAIIKFHRSNGAFNTGYIFGGARPPREDAIATAYIAPGYLPLPLNEFSVTGKSL